MNTQDKKYYREWSKKLRQTLNLKIKSNEIQQKIRKLEVYRSAKTVMSYMAKEIEISLDGLFEDRSKKWFLPVVETCHGMSLYAAPYVAGETKLIKNKFNILEPEESKVPEPCFLDIILVPGLCFDKRGYRIGFGLGYYDNFLKLNPNSFKIGSCPKECLVDNLPTDSWDQKVDLLVTD